MIGLWKEIAKIYELATNLNFLATINWYNHNCLFLVTKMSHIFIINLETIFT